MSSISFKNVPVVIGGIHLYASQASIEENLSYDKVESLGRSTVATVESSRPNGTFSADFYLHSSLVTSFLAFQGLVPIAGSIGPLTFASGYMTEFSINIEPLSLVKASVKGVFFSKFGGRDGSWTSEGVFDKAPSTDFAHGANSYNIDAGREDISVNFVLSQSFTPHYAVGTEAIIGVEYNGGDIKVSIKGRSLQDGVGVCAVEDSAVELQLAPYCVGNPIAGTAKIEGFKITSSSISVSAGGDLEGSMELIKYI